MSVIFCDGDCELWYEKINELGLKLIKMPYTVDGEEYFYDCGEKTDFKGFFAKLRAKKSANTSALNTEIYRGIFEPYFKAGEEILYITFSSKMSSTFNYLDTVITELSKEYPDAKYYQFDTLSISMGAGLQVELAAKYWRTGKSIEEVVEYLGKMRDHVSTSFVVDDLGHLKRGGRLSATSALVGGIFDIKPILKVSNEGTLAVVAKARGRKMAINTLVGYVRDGAVDIEKYPIYVLDADCKEDADVLEAKIRDLYPDKKLDICRQYIGPVIGVHCGPGTLGVIFVGKER